VTTHTEGLKPCPICSSPAKVIRDAGVHHVLCMNMICSTRGPVKVSTEDAIAAWNTRPAQASEAAILIPSEWLEPGAVVPVTPETVGLLLRALSTTPAEPVKE
jgi:hypothetical protein